jgi:hypothetical protein
VLASLEAATQHGATSDELAALLGETPARVRCALISLRRDFGFDILCLGGRHRLVPVEPRVEPLAGRHDNLLALLRATRRLQLRDLASVTHRPARELRAALRTLRQHDGVPLELTPQGEVVLHERLRAEPAEVLALLRQRGPLPTRTVAALLHVSPDLLRRLVGELQARGRPIHLRGDALSLAA